ncbi:lipopolysaccharide biosynthesis protein [Loktanella salsilacus]|uniref:lipopolysaccharide biosynthesis protein n=1 Tax=Loktanella salsilacus TaxID=195913 RepID=UPI003734D9A9
MSGASVTVMTFLSGILIARVLGPTARGDYGAAILVIQMFSTLGSLSFFSATILYLRRNEERLMSLIPSMLAAAFAISIFATAVFGAILPAVPIKLETISKSSLLLTSAIYIVALMLVQCFDAAERGQMVFGRVNLSRVAAPATFTLLLFVAWLIPGLNITALTVVILFLLSKAPELLILANGYLRHAFSSLDLSFIREIGPLGLRLHIAVALSAISSQIDRIVAVGVWNSGLLGQYFVAYSAVGAGFAVLTTAVNTILLPYLAGLESDRRTSQVMRTFRLTVLVSIVFALVGVVFLPNFVPWVYGADYDVAGALSVQLVLAMVFLPLRALVLETTRSRGRGWPAVELSLVSMAVMIMGYFLTGFVVPAQLIATFALANLLSVLTGMRHLWKDGDIKLGSGLLPGVSDLHWLFRALRSRGKR